MLGHRISRSPSSAPALHVGGRLLFTGWPSRSTNKDGNVSRRKIQFVLLAASSWYCPPSKHETFTQGWFIVGPASQMVDQH